MLYDLNFSNILYITAGIVVTSSNLTKQLPKSDLKIQVIRYLSSAGGGPKLINVLKYSDGSWNW